MSFVTDDWANFIVFVLPEEVKVYTPFGEKRVSENLWAKIWNPGRPIVHMLGQHLEDVSTFWWKMSTFGGQGKLRSIVHGPYRKENKTTFWLQKSFFCLYLDPSSTKICEISSVGQEFWKNLWAKIWNPGRPIAHMLGKTSGICFNFLVKKAHLWWVR